MTSAAAAGLSLAIHARSLARDQRRLGELSHSDVPESAAARHRTDRPAERAAVGASEASAAPVAAALANAFFDATGVGLRRALFTPERVKAALAGRAS